MNSLTGKVVHFPRDFDCCARQHWPVGRAVFYTKNKDLVAWINHSEHLTLKSQERRGNVRAAVSRLQSFVSLLENQLKFSWQEKLGYLALKPSNIGNYMLYLFCFFYEVVKSFFRNKF